VVNVAACTVSQLVTLVDLEVIQWLVTDMTLCH